MIRKMRSEDKKTYMEMAREFYHSDAVLHPVPDTYFERTADEALRSDVYAEIFLFECENEAAGYGSRKLILRKREEWFGGLKKCMCGKRFVPKGSEGNFLHILIR